MDPGSLGVPGQPDKQYGAPVSNDKADATYHPNERPEEDPVTDDNLADRSEEIIAPVGRNTRKAKRNEARAFGKSTHRGDVFVNRFQEHQYAPGERSIAILRNVRGVAMFVIEDLMTGKANTMRSRTLMERYRKTGQVIRTDTPMHPSSTDPRQA
jgi:hypothetical protein